MVRNQGVKIATGKYIAFCDDDDIWFPPKIELQVKAMIKNDCQMSSTEGLFGHGIFDFNKKYSKYNSESYFNTLKNIFIRKKSPLLNNGFPQIWTKQFLLIHNCMICSSVIMEKNIYNKIGGMINKKYGEDYDCWLKALNYTNSVYIDEPLFYYDNFHGKGSLFNKT